MTKSSRRCTKEIWIYFGWLRMLTREEKLALAVMQLTPEERWDCLLAIVYGLIWKPIPKKWENDRIFDARMARVIAEILIRLK